MLSTVASFHFNERRATKSGLSSLTSRASNLLFNLRERRATQPLFPHAIPRFPGERLCRSPAGPLSFSTRPQYTRRQRDETSAQLGRRRRERSRQQLLAQSGIVAASWKKKTRVMSEMN